MRDDTLPAGQTSPDVFIILSHLFPGDELHKFYLRLRLKIERGDYAPENRSLRKKLARHEKWRLKYRDKVIAAAEVFAEGENDDRN